MIKTGLFLTLSIFALGASLIPPLGSPMSFALDGVCALFFFLSVRSFLRVAP